MHEDNGKEYYEFEDIPHLNHLETQDIYNPRGDLIGVTAAGSDIITAINGLVDVVNSLIDLTNVLVEGMNNIFEDPGEETEE